MSKGLKALLNAALEKLQLFLGYLMRVHNQGIRTAFIMSNLRLVVGMVVMDCKMHYEFIYYRKKQTTVLEKCLSRHGSMLCSRYNTEEIKNNPSVLPYCTTNFDHVSARDSEQDYISVMFYFVTACRQIATQFSHIQYLPVQFDNVRR